MQVLECRDVAFEIFLQRSRFAKQAQGRSERIPPVTPFEELACDEVGDDTMNSWLGKSLSDMPIQPVTLVAHARRQPP